MENKYLGNNRITVSLADGHIEDVNHYYPFGGLMGDSHNTTAQPYKYIGKELDRAHSLDWYDHGARHYDPVTGRWNVMVPWRRNTTYGRTMSVHQEQMVFSQKKWEDYLFL